MATLRSLYTEIIVNQKKGVFPTLVRFLCWVASLVYRPIVAFRNCFYDLGWFTSFDREKSVVISVGNVTVGGTGKTPLTAKLAAALVSSGQVAILSRGYRSRVEKKKEPTLLSRGFGPLYPPSYSGDEPFLLAENVPDAFVYVGKNRVISSEHAEREGAKAILLDDGFQYRKLQRDFEIVLIDRQSFFEQGFYLPRGPLRESPKSLQRASLLVVKQSDPLDKNLLRTVAKYSTAPVVRMELIPVKWFDLSSGRQQTIRKKRVVVFCGIAHPERFLDTVKNEGADVVGKLLFDDHSRYTVGDLNRCVALAKEKSADMIACTEKDKGKLKELPIPQFPIAWVKMAAVIREGAFEWEKITGEIKKKMKEKRR